MTIPWQECVVALVLLLSVRSLLRRWCAPWQRLEALIADSLLARGWPRLAAYFQQSSSGCDSGCSRCQSGCSTPAEPSAPVRWR